MATVTLDGLWPNVRPAGTSHYGTTGKTMMDRFIEGQDRRAQYRISRLIDNYDRETLRGFGLDEAEIRRLTGNH